MSRLRVVGGGEADAAADALRSLAVALVPLLRDLLRVEAAPLDLVDVVDTVPGPKRTLLAACRRGEVSGAAKVGRRWLAPRASLEAWLRARGPVAVPTPDDDDDDDELEAIRAQLASPDRRRRSV